MINQEKYYEQREEYYKQRDAEHDVSSRRHAAISLAVEVIKISTSSWNEEILFKLTNRIENYLKTGKLEVE